MKTIERRFFRSSFLPMHFKIKKEKIRYRRSDRHEDDEHAHHADNPYDHCALQLYDHSLSYVYARPLCDVLHALS